MLNPHGIPIIWGLNHVTNPYFPGFTTLIISFLIVPITYYYIVIGYYYHCHYSSGYHYYHELLKLHIITITITINIIIIMTISIIYYQWLSSSQPPPALLELCRALISGDEDDKHSYDLLASFNRGLHQASAESATDRRVTKVTLARPDVTTAMVQTGFANEISLGNTH